MFEMKASVAISVIKVDEVYKGRAGQGCGVHVLEW